QRGGTGCFSGSTVARPVDSNPRRCCKWRPPEVMTATAQPDPSACDRTNTARMMRSQISETFDSAPFIGLVFEARMPTQKYTLDLPRLVPEVECLITVDLVAQLVGLSSLLGHVPTISNSR